MWHWPLLLNWILQRTQNDNDSLSNDWKDFAFQLWSEHEQIAARRKQVLSFLCMLASTDWVFHTTKATVKPFTKTVHLQEVVQFKFCLMVTAPFFPLGDMALKGLICSNCDSALWEINRWPSYRAEQTMFSHHTCLHTHTHTPATATKPHSKIELTVTWFSLRRQRKHINSLKGDEATAVRI